MGETFQMSQSKTNEHTFQLELMELLYAETSIVHVQIEVRRVKRFVKCVR